MPQRDPHEATSADGRKPGAADGAGSSDGTEVEEVVEDAIEFFSPDDEEQKAGDLTRHPPDGVKDGGRPQR